MWTCFVSNFIQIGQQVAKLYPSSLPDVAMVAPRRLPVVYGKTQGTQYVFEVLAISLAPKKDAQRRQVSVFAHRRR